MKMTPQALHYVGAVFSAAKGAGELMTFYDEQIQTGKTESEVGTNIAMSNLAAATELVGKLHGILLDLSRAFDNPENGISEELMIAFRDTTEETVLGLITMSLTNFELARKMRVDAGFADFEERMKGKVKEARRKQKEGTHEQQ